MEAACPHLGAPLEHAALEERGEAGDLEDTVVVWWHQYDFQLSTGESSTGLSSCVYTVTTRDGDVWVETPHSDPEAPWEVVEVRAVSEALVLSTAEPLAKVAYTQYGAEAFRSGQCRTIGGGRWGVDGVWTTPESETPPAWPPRLPNEQRVAPGAEGKRGKGGTERSRIALLHALANIEQWAIDLAWEYVRRSRSILARAPRLSAAAARTDAQPTPKPTLPTQFYSDFLKVALDEAKHFTLLQRRLMEMGSYFGALPVHHGLWESAVETSESLSARLCMCLSDAAIIHLVHEARGLDVNPVTIRKFAAAGDERSVAALNVIHLDEITHVSAGHRWLTYLCTTHDPPLDPVAVFREEVRRNFVGKLKGPFNEGDRAQAGLSRDWYDGLVGEKEPERARGVQRTEVPGG
ncbi:hypothetical protein CBS9595_003025 [Malassezia furfur]|nr:hypothetical protein CBS9595_003025 [Malassezia furfur]